MLLLIDNYDHLLTISRSISASLDVRLSLGGMTRFRLKEIGALAPERICISPGPCTPREAGISKDVILAFGARDSNSGCCLGHQCIAEATAEKSFALRG